jgi:hypothetical protein
MLPSDDMSYLGCLFFLFVFAPENINNFNMLIAKWKYFIIQRTRERRVVTRQLAYLAMYKWFHDINISAFIGRENAEWQRASFHGISRCTDGLTILIFHHSRQRRVVTRQLHAISGCTDGLTILIFQHSSDERAPGGNATTSMPSHDTQMASRY